MTVEDGLPGKVGLLGSGLLHDAIAAELRDQVELGPCDADRLTVVVVASDAWDLEVHHTARSLTAGRIPWLPVHTELNTVVIGPIEEPGRAGCVECARQRRRRLQSDWAERDAIWQRHGARLATHRSTWLTTLAARVGAILVRDEVDQQASARRVRNALLRIDLARLHITRHPFLPDPACPVCGALPDDTPELAQVVLSSRRAHRPGSYRVRDIAGELPGLVESFVDEEVGVISRLQESSIGGLVVTAAPTGLRTGPGEVGYGRAASFRDSRLTAVLEALERYGAAPGARRTVVEAAYQDVSDHALDPRTLGLHTPEQYRLPGYGFAPFSVDQRYRWVWGWSFARRQPLLVPEACAYYQLPGHHREPGRPFVYEISNGCALGGCLEEAILYGLLEVAERDAFLMTWYAQLPVPMIDLATGTDPAVPLHAAAIRAETGYHVRVFDITTEQGIPAVWAMAVNPDDNGQPALTCAAGSHPSPERAIRSGLAELGPGISSLTLRYSDPDEVARARAMVADPARVRAMADHALLYADQEAARRLDFLGDPPARRRVDQIGAADRGGFASDDLRDNLLEAVGRYTDHGMDVVVVDQTTVEHRAAALHCVKVLIPGTLSMTFGHQYRRVSGLPRLYEVPYRLGHRRRPLRPDDVNLHPHPFP